MGIEKFGFDKVSRRVAPGLADEQKFLEKGSLHVEGMYGEDQDQFGNKVVKEQENDIAIPTG